LWLKWLYAYDPKVVGSNPTPATKERRGNHYMGCLFILLHTLLYNSFVMGNKRPRINRESHTVTAMIHLYCRAHHSSDTLCLECTVLMEDALKRLEKCPFQEGKTTCAKCSVHCFKPDMREEIKTVMRYSGPRMMYRQPIMAILHLIDGRRKQPVSQVTDH